MISTQTHPVEMSDRRRKVIVITISILLCVLFLLLQTGCSAFFESTKEKQINFDSQVYGFKVVFADPSTGSTMPTGEFGFGSINYRSMPVERGQPFYARYTVKSLWSTAPASDTVIWVGRASERGMLTYEAVPDSMIRVGFDEIKTGGTAVTIKPEVK